jgi:L-lactate utilization protein LutB
MRVARDRAAEAVPEWEQLRGLASDTKEHVLSHLAEYLEQFEESAKRNGVQVHWANDAHDYNQIVCEGRARQSTRRSAAQVALDSLTVICRGMVLLLPGAGLRQFAWRRP